MRYSRDLQNRVVSESASVPVDVLAKKYNLPVTLIRKWLLVDLTEEQLRRRVLQKFYNVFPLEEAKIVSIFSDYIKEDISDDIWDELSKKANRELFEFALRIYKLLRLDFEVLTSETKGD